MDLIYIPSELASILPVEQPLVGGACIREVILKLYKTLKIQLEAEVYDELYDGTYYSRYVVNGLRRFL